MTRPLNVLLLEDSPDDAELLLRELHRNGYDVKHQRAQSAAELRAALSERWDLIVSDYSMPGFSAPDALAIVKEAGCDLPFIIVSGTVGEDIAVSALKSGAHDFMVKGRLARLAPAIERELADYDRRKRQREVEAQLLVSDRMVAVGTLAAAVAHEINNPLTAVIANLDIACEEIRQLDEAVRASATGVALQEELLDARSAADRVREIVRDLKIFSRGEDERRGPVDVERVLDSTLRMAHNEIRHRARLVKKYGAVPRVTASDARLGQVFLNVIINAAQALSEGKAQQHEIRIVTRSEGTRVIVEISDTGEGIAPDLMPRLFTPFLTTKPVGVGTGLGLSICRRILTELSGTIEIASTQGLGTTVAITLPVAVDDEAKREGSTPPISGATRRGRILVIDDDPMVARAVQRTLDQHDVVIERRAADALVRLQSAERFDVVLCDVMMPEMSGIDLYRELLQTAPRHAGALVFMTGGAFTAQARAFLDRVANARLEKPFTAERLRALIDDRVR